MWGWITTSLSVCFQLFFALGLFDLYSYSITRKKKKYLFYLYLLLHYRNLGVYRYNSQLEIHISILARFCKNRSVHFVYIYLNWFYQAHICLCNTYIDIRTNIEITQDTLICQQNSIFLEFFVLLLTLILLVKNA